MSVSDNDSANYFFQRGQTAKAREFIARVLVDKTATDADHAYSYFLLGEVEDFEGYIKNAEPVFRKSIALAVKSGSRLIESKARTSFARNLIGLGKYDSVLYQVEKSFALDSNVYMRFENDLTVARYWHSRNEHDKALQYYQSALDNAKLSKSNRSIAHALAGIGSIMFSQQSDMKKTIQYLQEANAFYDSTSAAAHLARNYARLANANMVLGNTAIAESYLNRAKRISDLSSNLPVRGYILSSLAILKAEQGDIAAAVEFSKEPIIIKRRLGQTKQLQNDLLNLAEWYMALKKYSEAKAALIEGVQTSTDLKDVVYLEYYYKHFATLDSLTGNFAGAYANLKRSVVYKDSVIASQRLTAVEEIREKYEAEQREKTIAEKELVIQRQKYQQFIVIGTATLIVLLLIVILIVLRNRNKAKLQGELQRQNQLRLQTIVHTQEEVQQSIARDIHDGLVQVLGAAKVSLQAIQGQSDRNHIHEQVRNVSQIIDEACVEARGISHQLLPYSLLRDGLLPALEELFKKSLPVFDYKVIGVPKKISGDAAINTYRIAQELINNIVKHSDATFVKIQLVFTAEKYVLSVDDNGKGFNHTENNGGVGLMNMLTRTELIGGILRIDSHPGSGARFSLEVPL